MSMRRHPCLVASLASCLLIAAVAPSVARAQDDAARTPTKADRQAARDAYDKGTKAFDKGDFVTALDSFVAANALIPSVQAMFWIARAQDKLDRVDAAVEAYEAITSRADFSKLSEDKAATVRERLAALKARQAPPPAPPAAPVAEPEPTPPPAEPAPAPVVEYSPMPVSSPPELHDDAADVLPQRNTAELGVLGGVLFVSPSHNLVEGKAPQHEFDVPTWQVGLRAAFFPEKVFGVEGEWAHGFGAVKDGDGAQLDAVRGHLIGQLPSSRFVPFALLGAGMLRASSGDVDASDPTSVNMGADTDFLLEAGLGFKVMATPVLVPRLDLRLNMTQKEGGGFTDGIALHPEILLGMSFTLGR
jgi:hypothetical protein